MSAKALHLNLLSQQDRQSSSPLRLKLVLPVLAGAILALVLIRLGIVCTQLIIANHRLETVREHIQANQNQSLESEALKAEMRNLQAEVDQYEFYRHGRCTRGDLLKQLAMVIPEGITLTQLIIPPQLSQDLQPPAGTRDPVLQGPTSTVEQVTLQLTGLAQNENEVFRLMENLKDKSFADYVLICEDPAKPDEASPKVLAFRQEAPQAASSHRYVFFDIAYTLKPREFVK